MVMPGPVRGIGNAGGFRMMVQDRSGAGPQALQSAVYAMMGRAAQTPGLRGSLCSKHRRRNSSSMSTAPRRSYWA